MKSQWIIVLLLVLPAAASAQTPVQFRWRKGDVLSYKVKNVTAVTEIVKGRTQKFGSRLDLTKSYRVVDVDAKGTATLDYSVTTMRNEQTLPGGAVLFFDSADLAKSTPGLREQLKEFVGTTLATLQVDAEGKVVAVKKGPDRYGTEPPFTLVLPAMPIKVGQAWARPFVVKLDPPLGTGQSYKAAQDCRCTKIDANKATITIATAMEKLPEVPQERVPLIQKETKGEVVFDIAAGRVAEVRLSVDRTLEKHRGPDSSYRFQSTFAEQYVGK